MIDDYWQRPVSEIGPFGPDKGQGGTFVVVPPGSDDEFADDHFVVRSRTNRVMYLVRGFVRDGDVDAAVETLAKIRIYPYGRAADPPATKIFRAGTTPMNSIAPAGFEYWERLAAIIDAEPVEDRDRFFHAMLRPLGIVKGEPFEPDERQRSILIEAATIGFLMAQTISMAPRFADVRPYPNSRWEWVLTLEPSQEAEHYSQLDERADYTFEAITIAEGMVKPIVGAGSQYMSSAKDSAGDWLDGAKSYRLRVPANVPVVEFWSITVYDNLTRSMIKSPSNRPAVSSLDQLTANDDGSIDIEFGPDAPVGPHTNWVQTVPDKGWFAYFRWYGPTQEFFDKTWQLPDIEPA